MKKSAAIFSLVIFLLIQNLLAQTNDLAGRKETHFTLSTSPVYGFVFAHDVQVHNTAGTVVTGAEIKLNRIRLDAEAKQYAHKSFNSGFSLAYYHFSKSFLGYSFYGSYFIEPYLVNNKNWMLGIVAKAGLSYNSNPYKRLTNDQNKSYSLYINPYLGLGFNASIKAGERLRLDIDAMFNHNSNGSFYHPNYGINFPTASLGITYDLKKVKIKKIMPSENFVWRFDIMPFASYKTIPLDNSHFYWIYGGSIQANRKIGFFNTVDLAVEWVTDLAVKKTLELNGRSNLDYHRAGVLLGHEFIFKKLDFSQQIGVYVFNENPYTDRIYHRWALYYKVTKNWMAGINLSAHRQIADYLDFRVIYSIYRKK
ncbi:MAG: acyloxyacyl hydrolase [Ginsengibacter sp.]